MGKVIQHTCRPGQPCGRCESNERAGGKRNHPTAPRLPAAAAKPARVPLPVAPCRFVGDELTAAERTARNLDHLRHWTHCDHPAKPLGEAVCGCTGCGPKCRRYVADEPATVAAAPDLYGPTPFPGLAYGGPVTVAESRRPSQSPSSPRSLSAEHTGGSRTLPRWQPVPPPAIAPTRPRAVITIVIGDDAEQLHAVTGPSQRRYAAKIGAEYVVLTGRTQDPRMPCAEKWRLKDYVPLFPGGTVYFDADVWVSPETPDILTHTPADAMGMVDVSPQTPGLLSWFPPEVERLCKTQGIAVPTMEPKYWNSGVWAGRPAQARYWNPPPLPYPVQWCTEEMWCRVQANVTGLRIHDLDPRFNWTWIEDRTLARVGERKPWVWHFAGMGNKEAEKLPQWQQTNRAWRLAMLRLLATVGG